ncbi:MAG TPA: PQQ-binding-like beta-propeller repeat protein [Planctomycetaceae bacterium]|nr:PQQ-binding-like beta-propeller repeat protein [Planctomycetaceae bacterium]
MPAVAVCAALFLTGADWRQFRGNESNGQAADAGPTSFDKLAWKAELPGRGLSAPVVVGGRVVLTASSGHQQDRLHVLCFDDDTGNLAWERQFWATGRTQTHPKICVASSSPASDGRRVFAQFSTNDVACLDLDGNLLWFRTLGYDHPNANNSLGMASSPVVADGTLVVQVESDAEAFALGIDAESGLDRWRVDRPQRSNWTSPTVLRDEGGRATAVLLQSSRGVQAVEPQSGKELWAYREGASTVESSALKDGVTYVPSHGLTALRPVESSDAPEMLWRSNRLGPGTASPVIVGDRVYVINSAGVLIAASLTDGEIAWRLRIEGPHTSSPVAAGELLYAVNEEGTARIIRLGRENGEVVAESVLGETILATPALASGALYVRSDGRLWKYAR